MKNTDKQLFPECRGKRIADDVVDCVTPNPNLCPYSMSFGYSYFCRHPLRKEIVARTLELEQADNKTPAPAPPPPFVFLS